MHILMMAEARAVHTRRWASALSEGGHQVTVLSTSEAEIEGAGVVPLRVPSWSWKYPGRWPGRYVQFIREIVAACRCDLIHVHYLRDYPLVEAVGDRVPFVVSTWGSDVIIDDFSPPESDAQRQTKVSLLQQATAVTATTSHLARETARYGVLPQESIDVIGFGVDLKKFAPKIPDTTRIQAGFRRVGFVKHLERRYGIEHFIHACALIDRSLRGVDFVVAGNGSLDSAMKALAKELGLTDRITWLGDVSHQRVPALLQSLDALIMPSLAEAFGVVAIEAQAVGTPVVCFDIPGVEEAVPAGTGGYRVPVGNAEALARMTLRLLTDPAECARLGERGRRFVERHFNFDDQVRAMVQVYKRTLGAGGREHRMSERQTPRYEQASVVRAPGRSAVPVE